MPTPSQLDHLVVAARSLDEGVAWCEAQLGCRPGPGGEHPLFGTHNRLLRLLSPAAPRAYLEIIAIQAGAPASRAPGLRRWFDLDQAALQARLASHGPQLVHWVASVPNLDAARSALAAQGIDCGPALAASRPTPQGLLQWRICVREDGQRLFNGVLPTLIEWGEQHPSGHMSGPQLALSGLYLQHPEAQALGAALQAIGLGDVPLRQGPAELVAELVTELKPPERAAVRLSSEGH